MLIYNFIPRIIVHTKGSSEIETIDEFNIKFMMVGKSSYDPSYYYDNFDLVKDSPITDVSPLGSKEALDELSERDSFQVPDGLDDENCLYVVTYGRKIVDLRVKEKNGNDFMPEITFEEKHHGNYIFIYQIEKLQLYPFNWPCYIMQGEERVYKGDAWTALNEFDPEGTRY